MKIYEFDSYKKFVVALVQSKPKKGYGEYSRISKFLNVHTTMVTQVLRGNLNFNLEQAHKLTRYLGLNELETEYFMYLVEYERAGDKAVQEFFKKRLQVLKAKALNLKERLFFDKVLDEKDQAVFYSNWYYSGIRLLTSIPQFQNSTKIADFFELPSSTVNRAIEFLTSVGLVVEEKNKLKMGPSRTYVGNDSPLVTRHHRNWRERVMRKMDSVSESELVFTNPVTISSRDFEKVREQLAIFIEDFRKIVDQSPAEDLCCLNIDWVKISK